MANITVTYTFSNGTTADADEVNTNFTDMINGTTDGTKDFSIGALTVAGAATLNGNVTLGNSTTDDITIAGSLASSIPVKTADTYDLGTAAIPMRILYTGDNGNSVGYGADTSASADWIFRAPPASGTVGHGLQATSTAGEHVYAPMQTDINAVSSANYTITDTDGYRHILVTAGASDRTITLPTAADNTDRVVTIKKVDSGAGEAIVDGEGAETIDGAATYSLGHQYDAVTVVSDGTSWHKLNYAVGKYLSANGSATSIATTTWHATGNAGITLTPGVWMMWATCIHAFNSAASVTAYVLGISTNNTTGSGAGVDTTYGSNFVAHDFTGQATTGVRSINDGIHTPQVYVSVSSDTTYYPKTFCVFSAGSCTATASIYAIRIA